MFSKDTEVAAGLYPMELRGFDAFAKIFNKESADSGTARFRESKIKDEPGLTLTK